MPSAANRLSKAWGMEEVAAKLGDKSEERAGLSWCWWITLTLHHSPASSPPPAPALREALQGRCRGRALSHHLSRALQQLLSSSLHSALQALDRHVIVVVIRAELGEQQ